MNEEHKKLGVSLWATVMVVALALYVVSFGPAWWMASRGKLPVKDVAYTAYRPLIWTTVRFKGPLRWWADLGSVRRCRRMEHESDVIWLDLDIPYQPGSGPIDWD